MMDKVKKIVSDAYWSAIKTDFPDMLLVFLSPSKMLE
jgi:hypothetical protein